VGTLAIRFYEMLLVPRRLSTRGSAGIPLSVFLPLTTTVVSGNLRADFLAETQVCSWAPRFRNFNQLTGLGLIDRTLSEVKIYHRCAPSCVLAGANAAHLTFAPFDGDLDFAMRCCLPEPGLSVGIGVRT